MLRPVERFLQVEAASGLLLLAAAAIALLWANSPLAASYDHLWHTPIRVGVGDWTIERDLHFWINELLMTVFFLLVGLEIKREMVEGALSDVRRAALPVAAAVGGMLVPAAVYLAINAGGPGRDGWGVPMATDIAFAVGVLMLLGKRVPSPLRVLLLAFAIIDDIGAILVIALFYSSGLALDGLAVAFGGLVLAIAFTRIGIRPGLVFALPLLLLWAGLYRAGIHPTIAGVVLGLLIPVRAWFGADGFLRVAQGALVEFEERARLGHTDKDLLDPLSRIGEAQREAVSPVVRGEAALHPWVAYGVMPLFALANAGVELGGLAVHQAGGWAVLVGVTLGLLVGKPLGILVCAWVSVRLGLCVLPPGVSWRGVGVVGLAGAIGFTMAIFIAELAFTDPALLNLAKLGVLIATALAGAGALLAGRLAWSDDQPADIASITDSSAESTTALWSGPHPTAFPRDARG